MRHLTTLALCGVFTLAGAADDKKPADPDRIDTSGGVREVELKSVKEFKGKGNLAAPTKITSDEELKKALGENAVLGGEVDFKKEYLLLFRWSGVEDEHLMGEVGEGKGKKTAQFTVAPGQPSVKTVPHAALFAVPVGLGWKVSRGIN